MAGLKPRIIERVLQRSTKKRWTRRGGKNELVLYYEPGDPTSHLCAQLIPYLKQRLNLRIHVVVVPEPEPTTYPEPDKQRRYALDDAARVAPAYGLQFPDNATRPNLELVFQAAQLLLSEMEIDKWLELEAQVAPALFANDNIAFQRIADDYPVKPNAARILARNGRERAKRGHYSAGMWFFAGRWYWGLDRFDFLERDLRQLGVVNGEAELLSRDASKAVLPSLSTLPELEFFYSFRSPYSYLALPKVRRLMEKYDLAVTVKPVLPMVMRGLPIPKSKRLYIARDAMRIAKREGIAFGCIADPVGPGALRGLKVFNAAVGPEQQLNLLQSVGAASFAEGKHVHMIKPILKDVVERAGVDWSSAGAFLKDDAHLVYAETNRQRLFDLGLWGVPSFKFGELVFWGQDRLWLIDEAVRRCRDAA